VRESIITALYYDDSVNLFIKKIRPIHLQDDFKQELFLIISQEQDERIIALYREHKLNYYVARIMCNMFYSKTSRFYYQYVKRQDQNFIVHHSNTELEQKAVNALKSLNWYEQEILRLYAELGSCRKVQAETMISHKSIMNTVNAARKQLKKIINNND
jgi:hypothetical protein